MAKTFPLSWFDTTSVDKEMLNNLRSHFLSLRYSHDIGYGFRNVVMEGFCLSAVLVKRTATIISQFDMETGHLIDQEVFLFAEIGFRIDREHQLLEIFGPARDASKAIPVLRALLGDKVGLTPVSLRPSEVVELVAAKSERFVVERLTVNNFQHRDGVIGRYEMRITMPDLVTEIIHKYASDLSRITIMVSDEASGDFAVSSTGVGRLTVKCLEDRLDDALSFLKLALLTKKE